MKRKRNREEKKKKTELKKKRVGRQAENIREARKRSVCVCLLEEKMEEKEMQNTAEEIVKKIIKRERHKRKKNEVFKSKSGRGGKKECKNKSVCLCSFACACVRVVSVWATQAWHV